MSEKPTLEAQVERLTDQRDALIELVAVLADKLPEPYREQYREVVAEFTGKPDHA